MTAQPVAKRGPRAHAIIDVLNDYVAAALTADAGVPRREWVVTATGLRITGLQVKSAVAGANASGTNVIDVKLNGTSIFAATGDRPTLAFADSGFWTFALEKSGNTLGLVEGDIISWDVISIGNVAGPTRTSISIALGIGK